MKREVHMETKLLKADEIADILKISLAKAYTMLQRGELPTVRIGRLVRVRQSDLEKYIYGGDATDPSKRPPVE